MYRELVIRKSNNFDKEYVDKKKDELYERIQFHALKLISAIGTNDAETIINSSAKLGILLDAVIGSYGDVYPDEHGTFAAYNTGICDPEFLNAKAGLHTFCRMKDAAKEDEKQPKAKTNLSMSEEYQRLFDKYCKLLADEQRDHLYKAYGITCKRFDPNTGIMDADEGSSDDHALPRMDKAKPSGCMFRVITDDDKAKPEPDTTVTFEDILADMPMPEIKFNRKPKKDIEYQRFMDQMMELQAELDHCIRAACDEQAEADDFECPFRTQKSKAKNPWLLGLLMDFED